MASAGQAEARDSACLGAAGGSLGAWLMPRREDESTHDRLCRKADKVTSSPLCKMQFASLFPEWQNALADIHLLGPMVPCHQSFLVLRLVVEC